METAHYYNSERDDSDGDRKDRRSYAPAAPEPAPQTVESSPFTDPRRVERPPLPPLEGLIHIRHEAEPSVDMAAVQHQQQEMAEKAEKDDDDDDEAEDKKRTPAQAPDEQYAAPIVEEGPAEDEPDTQQQWYPYPPVTTPPVTAETIQAAPAVETENELPYHLPSMPRTEAQTDNLQEATPAPAAELNYDVPTAATIAEEQTQPVFAYNEQQTAEMPLMQPAEADEPETTESQPFTYPEYTAEADPDQFQPAAEAGLDEEPLADDSAAFVPPAAPLAFGGVGGNRPPINPYEAYAEQPPEPEPESSTPYYDAGPSSPAAAPVVTERVVERTHTVERNGRRLGLATLGVLGAVGITHLASKRRDEKLQEQLTKWQERVQEDQHGVYAQQAEMRSSQSRSELQQGTVSEQLATVQRQVAEFQPPETMHGHNQESTTPQTPDRPNIAPNYVGTVAEAPQFVTAPVAGPERPAPAARQMTSEQQRPVVYQEATPQPGVESHEEQFVDQYGRPVELKPNQHVERSAWHTIVVDEHGREVAGAINYGQGFQQERRQERSPLPPSDTTDDDSKKAQPQSVVSQQGMAAVGGAYAVSSLPSGMTGPSLPAGQPTHVDPQHQLPEINKKGQIISNLVNPWFWMMLALVFAAFFLAATA